MLTRTESYAELIGGFVWNIPHDFNIGVDVCDRWAEREPDRIAIVEVDEDGTLRQTSFGDLKNISNRIANCLADHGVAPGTRVGVLLPQAMETAATHIAIYKSGAVAVPLFVLFGPDALHYRIADAGIETIITHRDGAAKLRMMPEGGGSALTIFTIDGGHEDLGTIDLNRELVSRSDDFAPVKTRAEDPALIIYTSGTTGPPKGALHAHRVLLGHLPGMEMSQDFLPQPGDIIWTPADWAWIGGLLNVLLPALHHGLPVVAHRMAKFSGQAAFSLLERLKITNAFLPPTALKVMRSVKPRGSGHELALRAVGSGGETLGAELLSWGRDVLGVTINEFYGQTECNLVISSCGSIMETPPGMMGAAAPGHEVAVIDENGQACAPGVEGMIAVRRGDPVMFLEYWNNPRATRDKFIGDWLVTGDRGTHEEGLFRFVGRDDDIITSSGYRIGPGEIEDCLLRHPAVRMAAIVGKPDRERTEIVKAYLVLNDPTAAGDPLRAELQAHVKTHLAAHEYPREIEFLEDLPVTTTGKIIRRTLRDRAREETKVR